MIPELWAAPHADRPLDAVLTLPGSKSVTNRALIIAALAEAPSVLRRPLRSRDTQLMAAGLRALGTHIEDLAAHDAGGAAGDWAIEPGPFKGGAEIDCGLAGTVMRFLPPVATLADGPVRFDGDPRARERPMRPLIEALRDLDVRVDDDGRGALPFTVDSGGRPVAGECDWTHRRPPSSSVPCCSPGLRGRTGSPSTRSAPRFHPCRTSP